MTGGVLKSKLSWVRFVALIVTLLALLSAVFVLVRKGVLFKAYVSLVTLKRPTITATVIADPLGDRYVDVGDIPITMSSTTSNPNYALVSAARTATPFIVISQLGSSNKESIISIVARVNSSIFLVALIYDLTGKAKQVIPIMDVFDAPGDYEPDVISDARVMKGHLYLGEYSVAPSGFVISGDKPVFYEYDLKTGELVSTIDYGVLQSEIMSFDFLDDKTIVLVLWDGRVGLFDLKARTFHQFPAVDVIDMDVSRRASHELGIAGSFASPSLIATVRVFRPFVYLILHHQARIIQMDHTGRIIRSVSLVDTMKRIARRWASGPSHFPWVYPFGIASAGGQGIWVSVLHDLRFDPYIALFELNDELRVKRVVYVRAERGVGPGIETDSNGNLYIFENCFDYSKLLKVDRDELFEKSVLLLNTR